MTAKLLTGIKDKACEVNIGRRLLNHLKPSSLSCLTDIVLIGLSDTSSVVDTDDIIDPSHACKPEEIDIRNS